VNAGTVFGFAWRNVRRLPGPVARGLFDAGAFLTWVRRGEGVRRLEANLARVRPDASRRDLRRLSLANLRGYMRYYCESFQLPGLTHEQVDARVRPVNVEPVRAELAAGRSVIFALGHCGNWDLAGAWSTRHLGGIVAVVEHLEPEELFREFLAFREGLGMTVVPFEKGGSVFRRLVTEVRSGSKVAVLLADRDLSAGGLEANLLGHPLRVAAGPAALAVTAGVPIYTTRIWHERLRGDRRRRAGSPWGVVIEFASPLVADRSAPRPAEVERLTQAWVDLLGERIREHPQDWHMLQKVFVADLDPERLARAGSKEAAGS
jgi:lauroyl/myristoyl acyltransferase